MSATGKAHPGDELLELYALGRLDEPELGEFEEHILVCELCQDRLDEATDFVVTMQAAASQMVHEPEPEPAWRRLLRLEWLPMPAPALAGAFALLVAVVAWQPWRSTEPAHWQTVQLETMRGEAAQATAPAGFALDLRLDAADIDAAGATAQIVSADGNVVADAALRVANGKAELRHAAGLSAGHYWVRLKKSGETVREYQLLVR